MSLYLWMQSEPCNKCGHSTASQSYNYTYNVSSMWQEIYPDDKQMVDIDNMKGHEVAKKLFKAIDEMKRKKKFMLTLNPKNGWGSYESFVDFLVELQLESEDSPDKIWRSCR